MLVHQRVHPIVGINGTSVACGIPWHFLTGKSGAISLGDDHRHPSRWLVFGTVTGRSWELGMWVKPLRIGRRLWLVIFYVLLSHVYGCMKLWCTRTLTFTSWFTEVGFCLWLWFWRCALTYPGSHQNYDHIPNVSHVVGLSGQLNI